MNWPFREFVRSPLRLSTQIRRDVSTAVRAVARFYVGPNIVHRMATLGILGYVRRTSLFGITCPRGTAAGQA